jgi:hypothetical protein
MRQNTTLQGDNVVLVFGSDDSFDFGDNATIRLSARTVGNYAGFVLVTTRQSTETLKISSNNVDKLLGTIYIPNANLEISSTGDVAEDSAWSVIVAKRILLQKNANLVINKNYAGSNVPVPMGVGNKGGAPRLVN